MQDSDFWEIVETSAQADISSHCGAISSRLENCTANEITGFADTLAEHLFRLDLKVLADTPVKGETSGSGRPVPQSEDGFLYARCAVILTGRDTYREIVSNPEGIDFSPYTTDDAVVAEELLEAAPTAFKKVTGAEWDHIEPFDYETGSNEDGWP
ncbi:DUF4240 domain-containing protein [Streptomyces sp. NPDC006197]|uniref:DUF4240 domain-containing protein n=1 Tax=Streptomyces sp. NPDC006197 TaxID=3156685 RepID=UPI00339E0045